MATIVSTTNDFSLTSSFTCTTVLEQKTVPSASSSVTDMYTSSASIGSHAVTFTYDSLSDQTVNMAVLTFTGSNTTYGGAVYIDDTQVYKNNDLYTFYLDPTTLGTTLTSFNFKFKSYTTAHNHLNDYDSKTLVSSTSSGTTIYHYKKNHSSSITLSNITLKIYTGEDFISVPSTCGIFVGVNGLAKKVEDIFVGVNGVAKKVSEAWVGVGGLARKIWPSVELKDVPVGSKIQLDEDGNGNIFNYIVVAQNHYLNDVNTEGHIVLMREQLLNTTCGFGNNSYDKAYEGEELDIYINETWKASLNGNIILKLLKMTIPCNMWSNPYTSSIERQIWVPSRAELDSSSNTGRDGTCFEYFINKTTSFDRIAYTNNGSAQAWWTRSCIEGTSPYASLIKANGDYTNSAQTNAFYCRPVFCLSNSLPVALVSDGVYDLVI